MDGKSLGKCGFQLRALGERTRLLVLGLLQKKAHTLFELQELLQIEQSLLSHHLHYLKKAGFVTSSRNGEHTIYSLNQRIVAKPGTFDLGCCSFQIDAPETPANLAPKPTRQYMRVNAVSQPL